MNDSPDVFALAKGLRVLVTAGPPGIGLAISDLLALRGARVHPPYLIPAAEVVPAPWTDVATIERAASPLRSAGHGPRGLPEPRFAGRRRSADRREWEESCA
jgi:NAD(P)-dependent dehydrogenase (short-subunit alcohol dehydrogenase family)